MWAEGRQHAADAGLVDEEAEEAYRRFDDEAHVEHRGPEGEETDLAGDMELADDGGMLEHTDEHNAAPQHVDAAAGEMGDDGYSDGTSVWLDGLIERAIQAGSADAVEGGAPTPRVTTPAPKRQGPIYKAMPPRSAFIYGPSRPQAAARPPAAPEHPQEGPRGQATAFPPGYADVNRVALQQYRERGSILLNDEAADLVRLRGERAGAH